MVGKQEGHHLQQGTVKDVAKGTPCHCQHTAKAKLVVEREECLHRHGGYGQQRPCPVSFQSSIACSTVHGHTYQQQGGSKDGRSGIEIVVELREPVAQHTGKPRRLVKISGKPVGGREEELVLLLIEEVVAVPPLEEAETGKGKEDDDYAAPMACKECFQAFHRFSGLWGAYAGTV